MYNQGGLPKRHKLQKTKEYIKANNIRTKLLTFCDKECKKYETSNLRINSKTTGDYYKKFLSNIVITLRTKNIVSVSKKKVSFLKEDEDITHNSIDLINKGLVFECKHHYNIFKEREKIVLSKSSHKNLLSSIKENQSLSSTTSSPCSCSTEDKSFLIINLIKKKENSKVYFDYLHTLYFSLHKNSYKGQIISEITLEHKDNNDKCHEHYYNLKNNNSSNNYNNNNNNDNYENYQYFHHEHFINENLNKFYKAINDNLESVNHLSNSFLPKRKYV